VRALASSPSPSPPSPSPDPEGKLLSSPALCPRGTLIEKVLALLAGGGIHECYLWGNPIPYHLQRKAHSVGAVEESEALRHNAQRGVAVPSLKSGSPSHLASLVIITHDCLWVYGVGEVPNSRKQMFINLLQQKPTKHGVSKPPTVFWGISGQRKKIT